MTATKIQPGDDLHLTSLMAPHSLNFVTGADRAALLAYGRDVFAAGLAGAAPAAVAGPADDLAELAMLNKLVELGTQAYGALAKSNSDDGPAGTAAYVRWQERRAEMGELIRAHKAPALEAPAAPSKDLALVLAALEHGHPRARHSEVLAAARRLAAAPQAPAAPWKDHQTARLVNDLRDCAIKYHGAGQLRERIAHIVVPLCDQLKGALAASAAPAVDAELLELAQAIVKFNREHGSILAVHIDNLADLVDERAAQAAAKGEDA